VGKAGTGLAAGQDQHWAAGDTVSVQAGHDLNLGVGEQLRVHTGQAIGVLGGAVQPGSGAAGTGLTLIAGQGPIDVQAQADTLQIAAKQDVKLVSVNASVILAAAKRVELIVTGGASATFSGEGITFSCPGTITVHAATKSFVGTNNLSSEWPELPRSIMQFDDRFVVQDLAGEPLPNRRVVITKPDGTKMQMATDGQGRLPLRQTFFAEGITLHVLGKVQK
jgi:uncharacterized protein (DUF2345 family)